MDQKEGVRANEKERVHGNNRQGGTKIRKINDLGWSGVTRAKTNKKGLGVGRGKRNNRGRGSDYEKEIRDVLS